jgi:hypothetical protein
MATARYTNGFGNVPGYGTVIPKPKKTAWRGGLGNSIQSGLAPPPTFTPQTYTPPTSGGSGASVGGSSKVDFNNLPVDPAFDDQIGGLTKTRDDTIAGLVAQRTGTKLDFGYDETLNPDGTVAALTFDPLNVNSRAAQMKKRYDQSKAGTTNSLAARGQLYSGAMANAQGANDSNYSTSSDSLQKSLLKYLAGNRIDQGAARSNFETNAGIAGGDRITRAINASAANTSAPTSAADAPAAASSAAKVDLSKWVSTAYKNANGSQVRVFGDGHKEVLVNGVWKRV